MLTKRGSTEGTFSHLDLAGICSCVLRREITGEENLSSISDTTGDTGACSESGLAITEGRDALLFWYSKSSAMERFNGSWDGVPDSARDA